MSPIGYRKINKRTREEVPANRITRGFEHPKGRYVIVSDEDLRRASPERTQRIDILSFADPKDVDSMYYDHPYYLAPTAKNEQGYALLREALRRSARVAHGTAVVPTRAGPAETRDGRGHRPHGASQAQRGETRSRGGGQAAVAAQGAPIGLTRRRRR